MPDDPPDPRRRSGAGLAGRHGAALASTFGVLAALVPIGLVVADVGFATALASPRFWVGVALLLAGGALVPYWAVRILNRRRG